MDPKLNSPLLCCNLVLSEYLLWTVKIALKQGVFLWVGGVGWWVGSCVLHCDSQILSNICVILLNVIISLYCFIYLLELMTPDSDVRQVWVFFLIEQNSTVLWPCSLDWLWMLHLRMHYRLYYALYLYENDSVSTVGQLSELKKQHGQQSIYRYRYF